MVLLKTLPLMLSVNALWLSKFGLLAHLQPIFGPKGSLLFSIAFSNLLAYLRGALGEFLGVLREI